METLSNGGRHFIIRTDHQSLKYLLEQKITTSLQQKGLTKLPGLDYEVHYKRGTKNRVADALSRRQEGDSTLCAITSSDHTWMQEVCQSYEGDTNALQLIAELIAYPSSKPKLNLQQGIIRFDNRIWVGKGTNLRTKIFETLHQSPLGENSGQLGTYKRVGMVFCWPNMKINISK